MKGLKLGKVEKVGNLSTFFQNRLNGSKLENLVLIGPKGFKWVHMGRNWSKWVNIGPNRFKLIQKALNRSLYVNKKIKFDMFRSNMV